MDTLEAARGAQCRELMQAEKEQTYEHVAAHLRLDKAYQNYAWKGAERGCHHTERMAGVCGMCPESTVGALLECKKHCKRAFCLGWLLRHAFYFHGTVQDHTAEKWANCVRDVLDLDLLVAPAQHTSGMAQLLKSVKKIERVFITYQAERDGVAYSICDMDDKHEIMGGFSSNMTWAWQDARAAMKRDIRTTHALICEQQ